MSETTCAVADWKKLLQEIRGAIRESLPRLSGAGAQHLEHLTNAVKLLAEAEAILRSSGALDAVVEEPEG